MLASPLVPSILLTGTKNEQNTGRTKEALPGHHLSQELHLGLDGGDLLLRGRLRPSKSEKRHVGYNYSFFLWCAARLAVAGGLGLCSWTAVSGCGIVYNRVIGDVLSVMSGFEVFQ